MEYQLFQIKRGQFRGQWRWRLRAENGRIIANSGESYVNQGDCLAAVRLVKDNPTAPVVTVAK